MHSESPSEPTLLGDDAGTVVTITARAEGPPGRIGIGAAHHVALTVDSYDCLLKWKRWLQYHQIPVLGSYDQQAYQDIVFTDPDGVLLEIATSGPGWEATRDGRDVFSPPRESMAPYRDEQAIQARTWREPITRIEPDMMLRGLHHVSTIVSSLEETGAFHREVLGILLIRKTIDNQDPKSSTGIGASTGGPPGMLVTAFTIVHAHEGGKPVYDQAGPGVVDHLAFAVGREDAIGHRNARLSERGLAVTRGVNEAGAASLSFRGPDGQLLELADASDSSQDPWFSKPNGGGSSCGISLAAGGRSVII